MYCSGKAVPTQRVAEKTNFVTLLRDCWIHFPTASELQSFFTRESKRSEWYYGRFFVFWCFSDSIKLSSSKVLAIKVLTSLEVIYDVSLFVVSVGRVLWELFLRKSLAAWWKTFSICSANFSGRPTKIIGVLYNASACNYLWIGKTKVFLITGDITTDLSFGLAFWKELFSKFFLDYAVSSIFSGFR